MRNHIDPQAIVDLLLKIPGRLFRDGWVATDDMLTVAAQMGIQTSESTLLDALRQLYQQQRIKHKQHGVQHLFKLANASVELARQDADYIQEQLCLTHWTPIGEGEGIKASPNPTFWAFWKRDRHAIKRRTLVVDHDENRKWAVYCFDALLSDILLEGKL